MKRTYPCPIRFARTTVFSAILFTQIASQSVFAVTYYWDNDGATAGFGTAAGTWEVPTAGSATQGWSTSATGEEVPAEVTTTTSDVLNFGNGATGLAVGTITVSGTVDANKLVIASGSDAITLTGGTVALGGTAPSITVNKTGQVIGSALTLGANTSVIMGGGSTSTSGALSLALNGAINGTGNLTLTTAATSFNNADQVIDLGAASSYTGATLITTGNTSNRLRVKNTSGAADALSASTVLTLDGGNGTGSGRNLYFDLNGQNQTLAGLNSVNRSARNQRVLNTGGAPATLTVNNSDDCAFGRAVTHTFNSTTYTTRARIEGDVSLVKSGVGTFTLAESHTYTGNTTINAGKLRGKLPGSCVNSDLIIADAAANFSVQVTDSTKSWTCAAFTPTAAGTLEFDFGAVEPSTTVSPLIVTDAADFSAATPQVSVLVSASLPPGTYPLMTWGSLSGTAPTTAGLTVSQLPFGSSGTLEVSGNTLNLVITSNLSYTVKANNTDNLNLGASWVGGTAPAADDIAKWNSTVTAANATVLGADTTWAGLVIENPTGPVSIGAGNTLTLGAADTDIDLQTATADLTLNCGLALGDANTWDVTTERALTVGGGVSGAFPVTKKGDGTLILSGTNTWSGNTTVSAGLLKLAAADVIPNGTGTGNVSIGGTLDLNGFSETINGLSGSGIVDNGAGLSPITLTVGDNDASSTFSGVLQNTVGSLSLVKTGIGTAVLGGVNTLSGSITVNGGTLAFANTNPFDSASGISLAGGTTLRPDVVGGEITAPITVGATGTMVTINAPSIVGAGGTSPVPVTLNSAIAGDGNVTFNGTQPNNAYGTIILNGESTYAGSTLITCTGSANTEIFVRLGTENALPTTTVLTLDGGDGVNSDRYCQVDLKGVDQTLAGLTNIPRNSFRKQQIINSSSGMPVTLTVSNSDDWVFSGRLGTTSGQTGSVGANLGLTKGAAGKLTLSGSNAYIGATTITGGTLALGASNVLADVTEVSIGAATLAIGAGFADTVNTLDVTAAAIINVGAGASLAFAASSGQAWPGSLTITGAFVSGASLRFGTDANGLIPAQIAKISGPGLSDIAINDEGYITATVAASGYTTWAATNAGGQGPELDFDGDGVANGVEFFMNAAAGFTANPVLNGSNTITWSNGGNIPASAYGTQFVIQTSANLVDWTNVPAGALTSNTDGPGGSLTYTLTGTAPRFVRLMVVPE